MGLSILKEEIRQDRAAGSLFEPRIVMQRVDTERFAMIGAICKQIDTPIAAVVVRDFGELSLEDSLWLFLKPRVPAAVFAKSVQLAHDQMLAAGVRAAAAVTPFISTSEVGVHQFSVDGRLCWNAATQQVEFWFVEFQFGIGRIEIPLPGYRTPAELREQFGPDVG